jgi:hypothetical protein
MALGNVTVEGINMQACQLPRAHVHLTRKGFHENVVVKVKWGACETTEFAAA